MASATKSREELVLQKHYAKLVGTLSRNFDEVLRGLVSTGVINITDKNKIKEHKGDDRSEYLLDHYIERSLAAGINENLMKLLQVLREIPLCKPLAISVEQDLLGVPSDTTVTSDGNVGEENETIDELIRQVDSLKNEEITQLRQEIKKVREQGTEQIER